MVMATKYFSAEPARTPPVRLFGRGLSPTADGFLMCSVSGHIRLWQPIHDSDRERIGKVVHAFGPVDEVRALIELDDSALMMEFVDQDLYTPKFDNKSGSRKGPPGRGGRGRGGRGRGGRSRN